MCREVRQLVSWCHMGSTEDTEFSGEPGVPPHQLSVKLVNFFANFWPRKTRLRVIHIHIFPLNLGPSLSWVSLICRSCNPVRNVDEKHQLPFHQPFSLCLHSFSLAWLHAYRQWLILVPLSSFLPFLKQCRFSLWRIMFSLCKTIYRKKHTASDSWFIYIRIYQEGNQMKL